MVADIKLEQEAAVAAILGSSHPKKLLVAGAGAGKTSVFKKLLEQLGHGDTEARIVLTFINELKADLDVALGDLAKVGTLHSYCHRLLRQREAIRGSRLTTSFQYFPQVATLILADWSILRETEAPKLVSLMRNATLNSETEFFLSRSEYYDAVGYDDSVFRVTLALDQSSALIPSYELVVVDEFQDFNAAEVKVITHLGSCNQIVVAGDDDQALYGALREASQEYIRGLNGDAHWQTFPLPFCMRCPSVVVEATNDVIARAEQDGLLSGRIKKPYRPYPPLKGQEDLEHPKIKCVRTTVQGINTRNYAGRYIEAAIEQIPAADIHDSYDKACPTVLIIGAGHFLRQVEQHLETAGYAVETKDRSGRGPMELERSDGLKILKNNPESNLGWRILAHIDKPEWLQNALKESESGTPLRDLIPDDYKDAVLVEVAEWTEPDEPTEPAVEVDQSKPRIKLVTFEGAKGLSAHHVFIIGIQESVLPKGNSVTDADVARFVVALTRTRKQCHLIHTGRCGETTTTPSRFLQWIKPARLEHISVNA